jgi:hypothetical protein
VAESAPRRLEVLDHLHHQHAVGAGEAVRELGRDRVEVHVPSEIVIEPVDRVDRGQRRGLEFVPDPSQQIAATAADVEPAQVRLGPRLLDHSLHDFCCRAASRGELVRVAAHT